MAQERTQHGAWAKVQTDALIAMGVSPLDAEARVDWVLAHLPPGHDPATWIPSGSDLDAPIDDAVTTDGAAFFMASDATPGRYKRLITAKLEDE